MIKITIPVYYTLEYKTKKPKTFLVSLNWFRNAYHFEQNKVKHDMHEIIHRLLPKNLSFQRYRITYTYYYKNITSDLPNVTSMCSKWVNDVLQEKEIVPNDTVQYLLEETHKVGGLDKNNPRCEVIIEET